MLGLHNTKLKQQTIILLIIPTFIQQKRRAGVITPDQHLIATSEICSC